MPINLMKSLRVILFFEVMFVLYLRTHCLHFSIFDATGTGANLHDQCIPTAVCILDLASRNAQRNDQHADDQIVDA